MEKTKFTIIPKTTKVCVKEIIVTVENSQSSKEDMKILSVVFKGGCSGQGKTVSKLLEGKTLVDAYNLLRGITCGIRGTSCSDQLAQGIQEFMTS